MTMTMMPNVIEILMTFKWRFGCYRLSRHPWTLLLLLANLRLAFARHNLFAFFSVFWTRPFRTSVFLFIFGMFTTILEQCNKIACFYCLHLCVYLSRMKLKTSWRWNIDVTLFPLFIGLMFKKALWTINKKNILILIVHFWNKKTCKP